MSTESKTVQAIPLDTIGINGLDTQSNATALGPNWFTKADNIVYTEGGKVTFRKGLKQGTLQITGSAKIGSIVEHYNGTTTKHFSLLTLTVHQVLLPLIGNGRHLIKIYLASKQVIRFYNTSHQLGLYLKLQQDIQLLLE